MNSTRAWLILARLPGIGPEHARALFAEDPEGASLHGGKRRSLAHAGFPSGALDALAKLDSAALDRDTLWLEEPGHCLVPCTDPRYPPLLEQIQDPPLALFVAGDPGLLSSHQIAIVGSRNPSASGLANARDFARYIAAQGVTVTSGLAEGIDTAAHEGAMAGGRTIGVMGTGPDQVYPASNARLAEQISMHGALITEFPTGTPPKRENFPRRNRIISGMSLGTLVVEAARRSGSLITARLASEQGREVFAVPGSIHNPLSRGCHMLIRQGAKLVETAQDIFEELGQLAAAGQPPGHAGTGPAPIPARDPEYVKLLECLGHDPLPTDELARRTGLTAGELSSMLLILELEGEVISESGGRYARAPKRGR